MEQLGDSGSTPPDSQQGSGDGLDRFKLSKADVVAIQPDTANTGRFLETDSRLAHPLLVHRPTGYPSFRLPDSLEAATKGHVQCVSSSSWACHHKYRGFTRPISSLCHWPSA